MQKNLLLLVFVISFSCSKEDVFNGATISKTSENISLVKTFGGSKNDVAKSVVQTLDGGYIVAGFTQSNNADIINKIDESFDFLVTKFSSENTIQWQKTYGGTDDDRASKIITTSDGGFAVLGFSKSSDLDVTKNAGSQDFWLLKLTENGIVSWQKTFGFLGADYGTSLLEAKNGGFLLTGVLDVSASGGEGNAKATTVNHAGGDYWVIKTDNSGNLQWSKYFGGSFTDEPLDVIETTDNNFIIVGSSDSNDFNITNNKGTYDFWVTKISSTGNLLWEKNFGGSEIDEARAITSTNDGNLIIVGDSRSSDKDVSINFGGADVWVLKMSVEGDLLWETTIGGTSFDVARSIYKTEDYGFIISGSSRSSDNDFKNNGQNDALILKIDSDGSLLWQKTFGGSEIDFLYDAIQLSNKTIIAVGESASSDKDISENKGFTDALIIQINGE